MSKDELRMSAGRETEALIHWASTVEFSDIPLAARRRALLILADDMGAMLSAEAEPEVAAFHDMLAASSSAGSASLLRKGRARLPIEAAAIGNAVAASWNELDEGYRKAVCHAGLYTLPCLLAHAEAQDKSTAEVLRALVVSYEVLTRFARAWPFQTLKIHPHALYCSLGAATALGILQRVDADTLLAAVTAASTMGATGPYSQAVRGVLVRNVWAACGISNGMRALEWARCGIGGVAETPHDVYFEALGSEADPQQLTQQLGHEWAVCDGYHKINACCQYAHSAIAAVESLLETYPDLQGGQGIERIRLTTHAYGMTLNDFAPRTILGAKFSIPFAVATAFVHGHGGASAFDSRALGDPRVREMSQKIELSEVRKPLPWPQDRPAYLTIVMKDGQERSAHCLSARGGPDLPFEDEDLWRKVATLSGHSMPGLEPVMRALHSGLDGSRSDGALDQSWRTVLEQCFEPQPSSRAPKH